MSKTATQWDTPPAVPEGHYVDARIYTDPALFAEEQHRLLRKSWKFACHVSEIPERGDYRTLNHAGYPIIVIHGDDGQIRGFLNTCSHRSSILLEGPAGNVRSITCPFHLWSFDTRGNCVHITRPEGYEEAGICKENRGLREVRTEQVLGLVFINTDDQCGTLPDYIGDALETFSEILGTQELEVFHYHRVVMNANWKQWHETNMELYHEWGHVVNRTTAVKVEGYHDRKWRLYPNGHGTLEPFAVQYKNYPGWENRASKMLPGLTEGEFRVVDIFPNTTLIARSTSLRIDTSTPIAPGKTLVEYRGLGIKGESQEDRGMRQKHHNQFWGPLGRNVPEDVLFVEKVERANRDGAARFGLLARREEGKSQDDEVLRAFYAQWQSQMQREPGNIDIITATPVTVSTAPQKRAGE